MGYLSLGDACVSELLAGVGFDFLWIDTEHTAIDYQALQNHLIAARAGGTSTLVRIPENNKVLVKRVLEMGPTGIIFPMINTAEEAETAMKSCLYPPYGIRGYGPIRAVSYGQEDSDEYIQKKSMEICRCIQIETETAVKNMPTRYNNARKAIDEAIAILKKNRKSIGVSTGACDKKTIQYWHNRGINMISAGTDHLYLSTMAEKTLRNIRQVQAERTLE